MWTVFVQSLGARDPSGPCRLRSVPRSSCGKTPSRVRVAATGRSRGRSGGGLGDITPALPSPPSSPTPTHPPLPPRKCSVWARVFLASGSQAPPGGGAARRAGPWLGRRDFPFCAGCVLFVQQENLPGLLTVLGGLSFLGI